LTLAVAEALGVRPEKVFINQTDTATCPWDVGTHASRGTFMACNAALLAAKKARAKIFAFAEEAFPEEVAKNVKDLRKKKPDFQPPDFDVKAASRKDRFDLADGYLFLKDAPPDPCLRVEIGRILRGLHFRTGGDMLTVEAFYDPPTELPDWSKGFGNMSASYAFGAQAAEVEVDTDTGEVKILKLAAAQDVGKTLNPLGLLGQTFGALAQGLGYAMLEEVLTRDGKILNPGFTDYKIPTAAEMAFPMDVEFVETDDPAGPYGAKGVAEPGLVPTAPAIGNAIFDAVGVRVRDLPVT
ncbi:MAG: molybdopterin-dependent oxidoreductase, partial [Planctomycetes bacterium]|nr:molybdopterin-dependent oxidoreductase [Planctomycetota bacterium]